MSQKRVDATPAPFDSFDPRTRRVPRDLPKARARQVNFLSVAEKK
jgi:hypothetical protein